MVAELQTPPEAAKAPPIGPLASGDAQRVAEKSVNGKVLSLVVGDITTVKVDGFVYDITEDAQIGTGYGTAISQRGGKVIQDALDAIGSVPTGTAVHTTAGELTAEHVIHVNGPKFNEPETEAKLRAAVQAALTLADEKGIETLAFPPIGTGLYQVPLDLCARVMTEVIEAHLGGDTKLKEVLLVALDTRELKPLQARF